jgi:hypothetical protein
MSVSITTGRLAEESGDELGGSRERGSAEVQAAAPTANDTIAEARARRETLTTPRSRGIGSVDR